MPAFVVSSGSILPPEFPGKLTIYVVFSSLVAASGGLLFGYDIGITGLTSIWQNRIVHQFFTLPDRWCYKHG